VKNHFGFFWLLIYSYRNGLISRKEFIEHWEGIQSLEDQEKKED